MTREKVVRLITLAPSVVPNTEGLTVNEMNDVYAPYGIQLPANPTPQQVRLARALVSVFAGMEAAETEREAEDERVTRLANDPDRKAAYDAARAECYFDTETLFPGWVPQLLTPHQQADADNIASIERNSPPPWASGDPAIAALRDETHRLWWLSRGRSAQARAISEEAGRLGALANRLSRQDSARRRRETPGAWRRLVPWPATCQVCDLPIDRAVVWPHPLGESLGHEPPISWVARHPEYEGPRVLRPEHWVCNLSKGRRPDWEIPEDPLDRHRDAFITPPTPRTANPDRRGKGAARGTIPTASVVPASLDPSWPTLPPRRSVTLSTSEINALPFDATACPTCGVDVAKPPKGRKKCTSCGVDMFVTVIDKSRRRLVTEAEMQRHATTQLARDEKEQEAAAPKWRSAVKAASVLLARNQDEPAHNPGDPADVAVRWERERRGERP